MYVSSKSNTQIFSGGTSLESPGQEAVVLLLSMLGVAVVEVQIPKQLLRREAAKLSSWAVKDPGAGDQDRSHCSYFASSNPNHKRMMSDFTGI